LSKSSKQSKRGEPRGLEVLLDPALNKSMAFTREERERYGLRGLLPPAIVSQRTQISRALENIRRKDSDIERFIYLQSLATRNERLLYRLVLDHIEEILPLIYTPTVGQACKEFAHIFRQTRGMYVTADDRGEIRKLFDNWPYDDVRVIVVTDGERILGLGDLGANGMGIPIGKLALYTALGGIAPGKTLPVMFDVGTDNAELRGDPLYLGLDRPRLRGVPYFELFDEFVEAVQDVYPNALLQFEDFATPNAYALLRRYRDKILCFNDDIQGTAAMTLAGIHASTRLSGIEFADMRIMFVGAGSAATGIADLMTEAFVATGLSRDEARQRLWFVDIDGLVVADRADTLLPHSLPYAHEHARCDLDAAIDAIEPHALIGATGVAGTFPRTAVERMAAINEHPVIFALSNPTANAECTAEQAYAWTGGRAIFASGSPFKPVEINGETVTPGQGNNAHIFPGVGLGAVMSGARVVTDEMFLAAAATLAEAVADENIRQGTVYPPLSSIREISVAIAVAVAEIAHSTGLARYERPSDGLVAHIKSQMFDPTY
jgi:malate dehydrogenase (oxaloacetate-decarboxylating)(NADP+)